MAYDMETYEILARDLIGLPDISEKKMFGGVAFLLAGNMLCGVHKNGAMYRVGKDNEGLALALDGPWRWTGPGAGRGGADGVHRAPDGGICRCLSRRAGKRSDPCAAFATGTGVCRHFARQIDLLREVTPPASCKICDLAQ
ncbi:TfoX/Sxy family protein [Aliiroseovarius crassostreae]|nr:TfoX/Sxy family protein [Aliiroseovarius crassostreae]